MISVLKWLPVNNWNSEDIHGIGTSASNIRLWKGNWNFLTLRGILHVWFSFSAQFCSNIIPLTCSGAVPEHDLVRCSASSTLTERLHKKINSSLHWGWGGRTFWYQIRRNIEITIWFLGRVFLKLIVLIHLKILFWYWPLVLALEVFLFLTWNNFLVTLKEEKKCSEELIQCY